jgi:flavin-binding protein dodecin
LSAFAKPSGGIGAVASSSRRRHRSSAKTLRHVRGAWIKEQCVGCAEGRVTEYRVNMMVTFVLDD